jgi:FkbM family methyltransferase
VPERGLTPARGLILAGANDASEFLGHPDLGTRLFVFIEPQGAPFARLEANFASTPNVTLVKTALGAEPGEGSLRLASFDQSASLLEPGLHLEMYPIEFEGQQPVRIETLDTIMAAIPGEFDEMVLDVQGYELEVLKGAVETLKAMRRIKCEVNEAEVFRGCPMVGEIDAFLAPFGLERTETDLHGGCWGDAVYTRPARSRFLSPLVAARKNIRRLAKSIHATTPNGFVRIGPTQY